MDGVPSPTGTPVCYTVGLDLGKSHNVSGAWPFFPPLFVSFTNERLIRFLVKLLSPVSLLSTGPYWWIMHSFYPLMGYDVFLVFSIFVSFHTIRFVDKKLFPFPFFYSHQRTCLLILEQGEGKKRERGKKHQSVSSRMCPDLGPNLSPRHVPWQEPNLWPFGLQDNTPANWATPARAKLSHI